jgi:ureidoglycolate hydrolase
LPLTLRLVAQVRVVRATAERLTAEAWAPFGWLPVDDTDPADGAYSLTFEWGDPHLNVIAHAFDEVEHTEHGALCTGMFRHDTHTQALMVLDVEAVIAVAPADLDLGDPAHVDAIRAFHLRPGDVFVLHRGTWHWGPFPLGTKPVRLLNVQGRRYVEDNANVDLAGVGAVVEVVVE